MRATKTYTTFLNQVFFFIGSRVKIQAKNRCGWQIRDSTPVYHLLPPTIRTVLCPYLEITDIFTMSGLLSILIYTRGVSLIHLMFHCSITIIRTTKISVYSSNHSYKTWEAVFGE